MSTLKLNQSSVRAGIATVGLIGGFVSGYGVLVPYYIKKYDLDLETGGRLFALTGISALIGVFIATYLAYKIRGAVAGSLGLVFAFTGIIILIIAPDWNTVLIGVSLIGAGFGAGQVGISQLVVDVGGIEAAKRTNKNNIAFALSSVVVPILFGLLLTRAYVLLLGFFAIVILFTAFVFYFNTHGKLTKKPDINQNNSNHNFSLVLLLLGIFTYVGVETAVTGWIPTYLLDKGWSTSKSSLAVSVFFMVLLLVRLFILKYIHKINFGLLTLISVICVIPALFFLYATTFYWLAIVLIAAACAPAFPMSFAWMVKISPGNARVIGLVFFATFSGSMIFPYLIGIFMNNFGTEFAPLFIMIPAGLSVVFFFIGYRSTIQHYQPYPASDPLPD
jgi:fucose permease